MPPAEIRDGRRAACWLHEEQWLREIGDVRELELRDNFAKSLKAFP